MERTEGTTRAHRIWNEVAGPCHWVGFGALSLAGSPEAWLLLEASGDVVTLQLCSLRDTWPSVQLARLITVGPVCALGRQWCAEQVPHHLMSVHFLGAL